MADIEIEVKDSNPGTKKNTDNMNDVDIDGMEVEDETMKDVVGKMEVVDGTAELKKDVMDVDLLVDDLLKASRKAGEEIANKDVLLQIGLTGAGKVSPSYTIQSESCTAKFRQHLPFIASTSSFCRQQPLTI